MSPAPLIRGLYVITDAGMQPPERLIESVSAALRGGARVVQYRDKGDDRARRQAEAIAVVDVCRAAGALCLINDDVALAADSGADGVHIGREDGGIAEARSRLGPDAVIGVSCYNEFGMAVEAEAAGADYVAFGSVYPSQVKPDAVRAPLSLFAQARRRLSVPVVGIGGIDADNAGEVIAAGADAVAVISAVFAAPDVAAAARRLAASAIAAPWGPAGPDGPPPGGGR
ncbi:thiamine phosphate synthase [Arhodomonas aquaeolei]|uniref:thiamine phosphate synthase n=1 Tax=Arhodomonas aquaeolei TaxID=2369 RepID=UPI0021694B9D|nr:thiamine phosphate synthase [Arhodomonas aquaeolei]MCS4503449.1 thiamine phosphate synthase [Arhodomonas aquaeolei]